jgi:hypothetical protein
MSCCVYVYAIMNVLCHAPQGRNLEIYSILVIFKRQLVSIIGPLNQSFTWLFNMTMLDRSLNHLRK